MRTTVSIDDDVLRLARTTAAAESRTLSDLVTEALRERFARGSQAQLKPYAPVTFGDGGPLPGVDVTNNASLRDLMDQA